MGIEPEKIRIRAAPGQTKAVGVVNKVERWRREGDDDGNTDGGAEERDGSRKVKGPMWVGLAGQLITRAGPNFFSAVGDFFFSRIPSWSFSLTIYFFFGSLVGLLGFSIFFVFF